MCKQFAGEGYHVLIAGRTAEKINAVSSTIIASGGAARVVVTDTTKETEVIRLFDAAEQAGRLEVVVYNAGNNFLKDILDMKAEFFSGCGGSAALAAFWSVGKPAAGGCHMAGGAPCCLPAQAARCAASRPLAHLPRPKPASAPCARQWRGTGGQRASTSLTLLSTAASTAILIHARFPDYINTKGEDGMLNTDAYWYLHT